MKRAFIVILAATAMLLTACGAEVSRYNQALDGDRSAREKMNTALSRMYEANVFTAEETETSAEMAAEKIKASISDFGDALEGWNEAETTYLQLIRDYPDNPEYLNNLGNMHYYKAYSGLGSDLGQARKYLEEALKLKERELYKRNIELIDELESNPETVEILADNRKLVEQIRAEREIAPVVHE